MIGHSRAVAWLDRAQAALPLFCAVALPLGFYFKSYDPTLVKEVTLQAAAALAAALWLSRSLEAGRFELPARRVWPAALALGLLAWTLLSLSWNPYPAVSLVPALRQASLLVLFLAALVGPASTGWAVSLADWTLAGVAAASLYALAQRAGLDPAPWRGGFGASAFSTLGGPAALGAIAAAAWPIAVARASDPEAAPWRRGFAFGSGLLALGAVWASSSATAIVALAAGVLAFGARAVSTGPDRWLKSLVVGQVAAASSVMLAWPLLAHGERLLAARRVLAVAWRGALDMAAFKPLFGWGAGSFGAVFPDFRSPDLARWTADAAQIAHPRNEPLRLAAELGLVGVGLAAALALMVLWPAWRDAGERLKTGDSRSGALAAGLWAACVALLAAGMGSDALASPAPAFLLAAAAAALAALARERGAATVHVLPIPAPPLARLALSRLAAFGAVAMLLLPSALWIADLRLNAAAVAAERGDVDAAVHGLTEVWQRHPRSAQARYLAARILAKRNGHGDAEAALALYRDLDRLDPGLPQLALRRADAEIRLARWREAELSLARGLKREPWAAESWERLIEIKWILGKKEGAKEAALALVRLEPNNPERWKSLAQAYRQLKRPAIARAMERHATKVGETAKSGSLPRIY